jgi:phospholipase C
MHIPLRSASALAVAGALAVGGVAAAAASPAATNGSKPATATPIQHVVVIFQENVSFDHYFATYPNAANTDGSKFYAKPGTPSVNGLSAALLTHNPNLNNPQRLSSSQAVTCDQNHAYTAEQKAFDGGLMDQFVQQTGNSGCAAPEAHPAGLVMDYYDGNTVTGLWNYAQRYAMSDNSYGTVFGPSTPGALNLVSGQTYGATGVNASGQTVSDPSVVGSPNSSGVGTDYSDQDPYFDACSNRTGTLLKMSGPNIGDLLNKKGVSWGWFEGGFAPTSTTGGKVTCGAAHANVAGASTADYIPHHEPFQYYASTANPNHVAPANVAEVGHNGPANHQYDISWFSKALGGGNLPSVSFLKAPAYQDGHAGYSDPLDEQHFLVNTINQIEKSKYWHNTAVVINYDDSDGWYDHVMSPIINSSADPATDALNGPGVCGHGTPLGGIQDRCGYGQRLPMMVISPYAKTNYVDNTMTDQTSIINFIENNWLGGQRTGTSSFDNLSGSLNGMFNWNHPDSRPFILNPTTGQPARN